MKALLVALLLTPTMSLATTCKYVDSGYGDFIGFGADEETARTYATERCMDSLVSLREGRGGTVDKEQKIEIMLHCVNNVKCD